MEITAPVSGIIYGSKVFAVQSVVQKAKDIMHIVPQNLALVIAVRVAAQDVDQIVAGQQVSLRFTALDQRFTPEIFGILNTISADSFLDNKTGKAYYEAEISPLETELQKLGEQSLVPGMPVDAYIRTASRSPLNYLTKPLADYFYRAFREG
jgi:HlyD family secretion protein